MICALLIVMALSPAWGALLLFCLWRASRKWLQSLLLLVLPLPGLAYLQLWRMLTEPIHGGNARVRLVCFHTGNAAVADFVLFWVVTALTLLFWCPFAWWLARRRAEGELGYVAGRRLLLASLALLLAATAICAFVLGQYCTLQKAVEIGNLELAHRRLHFNWEGVGPDDGDVRTVLFGDGVLQQSSLLSGVLERRDKAMAALLIQHGANVNSYDVWSPEGDVHLLMLNRLIQRHDLDMVRFMLDHGADPNGGVSPASPLLWTAVERNATDIAKLLTERGANVSPSAEGKTLADLAEERGNAALAAYLRSRQAQQAAESSAPPVDSLPLEAVPQEQPG